MDYIEEHFDALADFFTRRDFHFQLDIAADYGFSSRAHWSDFRERFAPLGVARRLLASAGEVRVPVTEVAAVFDDLLDVLSGPQAAPFERQLGVQLKESLAKNVGWQKILKAVKDEGSKSIFKYAPLLALTVDQCYPRFAATILHSKEPGMAVTAPEAMNFHAVVICAQESWKRKVVPIVKRSLGVSTDSKEDSPKVEDNGDSSTVPKKKNPKKKKAKKKKNGGVEVLKEVLEDKKEVVREAAEQLDQLLVTEPE